MRNHSFFISLDVFSALFGCSSFQNAKGLRGSKIGNSKWLCMMDKTEWGPGHKGRIPPTHLTNHEHPTMPWLLFWLYHLTGICVRLSGRLSVCPTFDWLAFCQLVYNFSMLIFISYSENKQFSANNTSTTTIATTLSAAATTPKIYSLS